MNLNHRIQAFTTLGKFLGQFTSSSIKKDETLDCNTVFFDAFKMQIERSQEFNGWFTIENVLLAFQNWSEALSKENLDQWTSSYNFEKVHHSKNVAIIMAGNIPLVGFHDLLSVLITGHRALVKLSSNDAHFLPLIAKFLEAYNPYFKNKITFTKEKLNEFDAVIATGSNNTARYFEHYFGKYPHIIRKNRNSVAIITGNETKEELEKLGNDIFHFFGLGCRNVSKLYVPVNYNFDVLFEALFSFKNIINYKKYENNYDYNKAVYLMSQFQILENGFVMLKEDTNYASPIATVFYEHYASFDKLVKKLDLQSDKIQCIACNENVVDFVKFGETQRPNLWNYADNVDTIDFLLKL